MFERDHLANTLALSLYEPFAEDTSVAIPANFDLQYQVDAIVGIATVPETSGTTIGSFFLNYSLNPGDPSVTNPQVTFVKSNSSVTTFNIFDPCLL